MSRACDEVRVIYPSFATYLLVEGIGADSLSIFAGNIKTKTMKKIIFILAAVLVSMTAASAQDVLGKWKLEDGSAIVEVYQQGDVYNGKIV